MTDDQKCNVIKDSAGDRCARNVRRLRIECDFSEEDMATELKVSTGADLIDDHIEVKLINLFEKLLGRKRVATLNMFQKVGG